MRVKYKNASKQRRRDALRETQREVECERERERETVKIVEFNISYILW